MGDNAISRVECPVELLERVKSALEEAISTEQFANQEWAHKDEHWEQSAKTIAEIRSVLEALDRLSPNLESE